MSDSVRLTLSEYAFHVWEQDGLQPTLEDAPLKFVLLAMDALRVGIVPTLSELARCQTSRAAWVEAAKRLEDERAIRSALAANSPGSNYEGAMAGDPDESAAIDAWVLAADARIDAARGAQ